MGEEFVVQIKHMPPLGLVQLRSDAESYESLDFG
jgi:hypothetical protein